MVLKHEDKDKDKNLMFLLHEFLVTRTRTINTGDRKIACENH